MTSPSQYPSHSSTQMPPITSLQHTLTHFTRSPSTFQIVHTLPPSLARLPTRTLYILDSSFNPPTWAHMRMCLSALRDHDTNRGEDGGESGEVKRLLLLLATRNADKAPSPAGFAQRLSMMGAFAEDLKRVWRADGDIGDKGQKRGEREDVEDGGRGEGPEGRIKGMKNKSYEDHDLVVDIGVTKAAMFVEKARIIEESGAYTFPWEGDQGGAVVEQVHLTGYDTLTRLVDTKYYPPEHTLAPLGGLLEKHRVRVTMRCPPERGVQVRFVEGLREGCEVGKGWRAEWGKRIELVEGREEGEEAVSSTRARECFRDAGSKGDGGEKWCSESVVEFILREGLYLDDGVEVVGAEGNEKENEKERKGERDGV